LFYIETFFIFVLEKTENMNRYISNQQIGQRIAALRKQKGLSQEELAKRMSISRPVLTQIELGKRSVSFVEMQKFSAELGFSIDSIVMEDFRVAPVHISDQKAEDVPDERISVPEINVNKFRNVLLYILERCAGKPNVGETVLYKLLYFSDFNYYELYEEHLTGAAYKKLQYGPVPLSLTGIVNQMTDNGELQRINTDYHGYPQTRYIPLVKADLQELKASEKEVIDRVIENMSDWSASDISAYSHKDMPWLASEDGEDINYELVFYRDKPFSVRNYNDEPED
jgi:transcriptional regulator with XRE-family HTH domain